MVEMFTLSIKRKPDSETARLRQPIQFAYRSLRYANPPKGSARVASQIASVLATSAALMLKTKTGEKGFEPLTPWSVATCSSPLSYTPSVGL